ncbi:hypothetical protein D9758_006206 [Tetrapyrgos nigripes]|uniref:ATPase inhibitor, mitochondrial n=1 Tax=Tetrapyrgos nigripes TaxID=182062 RepID=A0A8H5GAK2_9AGAR|nr:hypothetical protein D9758_006206 [Tetrapyrgos nigripes]
MLSRLSAVRRAPRVIFVSQRFTSSVKEGSVANSQGFKKKENAHESEYARKHEVEQLKKLRAQIEQKKIELEQLEKEHEVVSKSS